MFVYMVKVVRSAFGYNYAANIISRQHFQYGWLSWIYDCRLTGVKTFIMVRLHFIFEIFWRHGHCEGLVWPGIDLRKVRKMGVCFIAPIRVNDLSLKFSSFLYYLCKEFGPISGPTECRSWPGSKLFDKLIVFLKEFSLFWKSQQMTAKAWKITQHAEFYTKRTLWVNIVYSYYWGIKRALIRLHFDVWSGHNFIF